MQKWSYEMLDIHENLLDIHENSGETNWDVQNIWATYPGKLKTTALLKLASLLLCIYETGCLMFCHILRQTWKALKTNRGGVRNWVLFAVLYGVQYLVWTVDLVWTCNSCICCRNMSYPTILLPEYLRIPSQEMSFPHWLNLISIMLRGQSMI